MAVIGARLFITNETSADKKLIAYNFDTAAWEDIYATGDLISSGSGMCWDGAYHLWWRHDDDYYKRLNLYDHSVSSFLSAQPLTSASKDQYAYNYNGLIYSFVEGGSKFQKFDHGSGLWSSETSPGAFGAGIVVPMSAVERPGKVFWGQEGAVTFKEFDPVAGTWANKLNAPGNLEAGDIVWADEFVFMNQDGGTGFYKYNVNANTWASMAVRAGNAKLGNQSLTWDYNDAGYIYWLNVLNNTIYKYDIAGDSWASFATWGGVGLSSFASICYVPRIRFLYLDSSGNVVANPMNLGTEFSGKTGTGTLYYVKALEAVGATTLAIEADPRTDADDLLDIAPDVAGVPGAWGASVNLGAMGASATVPFWIRIDAAGAPSTQPRSARLTLTTP